MTIHHPANDSARQSITAQLNNVYVREEFRKHAVGSALISDFIKHCQENHAGKVNVTVISRNTGAVSFYEKHGFTPSREILSLELDGK